MLRPTGDRHGRPAGASRSVGGAMVGLFALVGMSAALTVPALAGRMENPFPIVVVCGISYAIGFTGLLAAPTTATWLWIVFVGLGPSTFPLALTLINLRTRTEAGSQALSGFTQGIGYVIACAGPVLFGILHDATGGWSVPFVMLGFVVVVQLIAGWIACRPRMLEDSWQRG